MTARWRRWLLTTVAITSLHLSLLGAARADDPEPLPADDATLTAQIMGGRTSVRGREHLRGRFERDLPAALRRLTSLLRAADAPTRRGGAQGLAVLGSAAAPAGPDLVEALDDDDADVRAAAVEAIQALGAPSEAVVAGVAARAPRTDPTFTRLVRWIDIALGRLDPAALFARLADPFTRAETISALSTRGAAAIPAFAAFLDDPAWRARVWGADGLAALGVSTPDATARLVARVGDPVEQVRTAALAALVVLVPGDPAAAAYAATRVGDPALPPHVRGGFVRGLTHRLADDGVAAALRAHLRAGDPFDETVARALFASGSRDEAVLGGLARAATGFPSWESSHRNLRPAAPSPAAVGADLDLVAALRDAGDAGLTAVRTETPTELGRRTFVLGAIDTEAAWDVVRAQLDVADAQRFAAWTCVHGLRDRAPDRAIEIAFVDYLDGGPAPSWGLPRGPSDGSEALAAARGGAWTARWLAAWERRDREDRGWSTVEMRLIELARALGPAAAPIVAGLAERLSSAQPSVRVRAREGLRALGPAAAAATPAIEAAAAHTTDAAEAAVLRRVLDAVRATPSK
ncbi:MAG: HEAT repeat domain-containing protein [Planctomycetia bacterium]|nr:HEAT repeat domain-containing protein [Planctomycetia bacterium]